MSRWLPTIYDMAVTPLEQYRFKKVRRQLTDQATGRVLEIGSGTGLNFPFYYQIDRVDAVEPNPVMIKKAKKREHAALIPIQQHQTPAEALPFADNTFDTAVATLVFCTIPNPLQAFREIERVCKPGAKVLLFEHVRMEQHGLGKLQDILTPYWMKVCDGCHLNRDPLALLQQTNLTVNQVSTQGKGLLLTIEAVV